MEPNNNEFVKEDVNLVNDSIFKNYSLHYAFLIFINIVVLFVLVVFSDFSRIFHSSSYPYLFFMSLLLLNFSYLSFLFIKKYKKTFPSYGIGLNVFFLLLLLVNPIFQVLLRVTLPDVFDLPLFFVYLLLYFFLIIAIVFTPLINLIIGIRNIVTGKGGSSLVYFMWSTILILSSSLLLWKPLIETLPNVSMGGH